MNILQQIASAIGGNPANAAPVMGMGEITMSDNPDPRDPVAVAAAEAAAKKPEKMKFDAEDLLLFGANMMAGSAKPGATLLSSAGEGIAAGAGNMINRRKQQQAIDLATQKLLQQALFKNMDLGIKREGLNLKREDMNFDNTLAQQNIMDMMKTRAGQLAVAQQRAKDYSRNVDNNIATGGNSGGFINRPIDLNKIRSDAVNTLTRGDIMFTQRPPEQQEELIQKQMRLVLGDNQNLSTTTPAANAATSSEIVGLALENRLKKLGY